MMVVDEDLGKRIFIKQSPPDLKKKILRENQQVSHSTVAQRAEVTVAQRFLTRCVQVYFPADGFPHYALIA